MSRVRIPSIALFLPEKVPVSTLEAIFLGLIQGLTEFLPISSSGHLVLAQSLLGMENLKDFLVFNIVCHLGTLFAIFFVFSKKIKDLFLTEKKMLLKLAIALLPLFPLVFLLKPIKDFFDQPQYLGYFFLITAFILFLGVRFGKDLPSKSLAKHPWRDALTIGLFQAIAILPGVSRSGSTISGARLLGWSYDQAITFSFLLAIPTILAGVVLELGQLLLKPQETLPGITWVQYATGFTFSFIFGFIALIYLQKLASKQRFMYFVWYCLFLGIVLTLYF